MKNIDNIKITNNGLVLINRVILIRRIEDRNDLISKYLADICNKCYLTNHICIQIRNKYEFLLCSKVNSVLNDNQIGSYLVKAESLYISIKFRYG